MAFFRYKHGLSVKQERRVCNRKEKPSATGLTLIGCGLGSFCASSNALHQLGFLVALKRALDQQLTQVSTTSPDTRHSTPLSIESFDPTMNKSYAVIFFIAEHFHLTVLQENLHAQRRISRPSVFFMPHSEHILYYNVLACN
ncbi:hypothetical protein PsorP6_007211 [Peronosclerospora sorghi]|uniref:Uncharacterized protein n=1 Tax=Peronosclerospora sorghi TaxID=230839 RepID=A0ACC0W9Z6_9STRA|nr:hypothetical protein PsorP6_007211 [Peronosclerospora sorghi]